MSPRENPGIELPRLSTAQKLQTVFSLAQAPQIKLPMLTSKSDLLSLNSQTDFPQTKPPIFYLPDLVLWIEIPRLSLVDRGLQAGPHTENVGHLSATEAPTGSLLSHFSTQSP